MRDAPRRFPLEPAIQLAIAATIVTTLLAAGAIVDWIPAARALRWAALGSLAVLALAYAAGRRGNVPRPVLMAAGGLIALTLASVAWSSAPGLTLQRGLALTALFVACGALTVATAGRAEKIELVLGGVVLGVGAVAVGGLLVLLFDPDRALQPATSVLPARYQGLGGGPNTATMVMAIGVPATLHLARSARRPLLRAALFAVLLTIGGSIVASGSRGALVSAFVGLLVYAVLSVRGARRQLAVAAGVVVLLAIATFVSQIPQPDPAAPALSSGSPAVDEVAEAWEPRAPYVDPLLVPRLQDEVGQPFGVAETTRRPRRLLDTSGRLEAWRGALAQAFERPVLGYGFGTENRVFVERFVGFNSSVPENSYIGLVLQLGLAGLALLVLLVGTLVRAAVVALRRTDVETGLVAACSGVLAAGLALGFFQSYLYATGNNATAALWVASFMVAATAAPSVPFARRDPGRLRTSFAAAALTLVAATALVLLGRWERARHADEESKGMRAVVAAVGDLDSPTLSSFRFLHNFQCLLYRRGEHPFALELCVRPDGRLVEAIDRRSGEPRFWSLREDPSRAPVLDRQLVDALLRRIGVREEFLRAAHARSG